MDYTYVFCSCVEEKYHKFANIANLLCSVNIGEFMRIQAMLDTILKGYKQSHLPSRLLDTTSLIVSTHTVDIQNENGCIEFTSSTLLHDLIVDTIYKPEWLRISHEDKDVSAFLVKARASTSICFSLEGDVIMDESTPCVILRAKKKEEIVRIILIYLYSEHPITPRLDSSSASNQSSADIEESSDGLAMQYSKKKLGAAFSFKSDRKIN